MALSENNPLELRVERVEPHGNPESPKSLLLVWIFDYKKSFPKFVFICEPQLYKRWLVGRSVRNGFVGGQ